MFTGKRKSLMACLPLYNSGCSDDVRYATAAFLGERDDSFVVRLRMSNEWKVCHGELRLLSYSGKSCNLGNSHMCMFNSLSRMTAGNQHDVPSVRDI